MLQTKRYPGGLGNIIVGSVWDCNKAALERSLKFYDSQLYIKWNPNKRRGHGIWEIRRRPNRMTPVYQGQWQGKDLYTMEWKEIDHVHHVLDVPVLRYDVLAKIKSMDTFGQKNWLAAQDYEATRIYDKIEKGAREELKYEIKQHKQEWRDFARLVSEGHNPGQVLNKLKLG